MLTALCCFEVLKIRVVAAAGAGERWRRRLRDKAKKPKTAKESGSGLRFVWGFSFFPPSEISPSLIWISDFFFFFFFFSAPQVCFLRFCFHAYNFSLGDTVNRMMMLSGSASFSSSQSFPFSKHTTDPTILHSNSLGDDLLLPKSLLLGFSGLSLNLIILPISIECSSFVSLDTLNLI